jgi:hypothetical protein
MKNNINIEELKHYINIALDRIKTDVIENETIYNSTIRTTDLLLKDLKYYQNKINAKK